MVRAAQGLAAAPRTHLDRVLDPPPPERPAPLGTESARRSTATITPGRQRLEVVTRRTQCVQGGTRTGHESWPDVVHGPKRFLQAGGPLEQVAEFCKERDILRLLGELRIGGLKSFIRLLQLHLHVASLGDLLLQFLGAEHYSRFEVIARCA